MKEDGIYLIDLPYTLDVGKVKFKIQDYMVVENGIESEIKHHIYRIPSIIFETLGEDK